MEECRTPRSVAEIVAALRVPLGVARVLISDAADAGLVTVHKTITGNDGAEAHLDVDGKGFEWTPSALRHRGTPRPRP